jgi:hypothetical protein
MNMPGFTAEVSLNETNGRYLTVGTVTQARGPIQALLLVLDRLWALIEAAFRSASKPNASETTILIAKLTAFVFAFPEPAGFSKSSYTNRNTDVTEKFFVRVDVTQDFPFLVTKMSPYYDR